MLLFACVAAAAVGFVLAQGGGSSHSAALGPTGHRAGTTTVVSTTTTTPTTTTTVPPTTTTTTGPGSLPQTSALPTTTSPVFAANMAALWSGVSSGVAQNAVPGFFPEPAYLQLKDISGAASDYTERLIAEYEEDVASAHQLLGPDAASAQLVGVDVDAAYAHWVAPGAGYNGVGYFDVPNSRVLYMVDGQERSFGIASMISWRGEWYIVHLGAVLRPGDGGTVDDPQSGPGVPSYSSTC